MFASQPSVSIETLTTHLTCSPSLPGLPTVFITSRSRSSSVRFSASRPGKRARYSALNSSISTGGDFLEVVAHGLARFELLGCPRGWCSGGAASGPSSSLLKRASWPALHDRRIADQVLLPAGDIIEDQLRDVGVVADDDEDRRRDALGAGVGVLLPRR